MSRERLTATFAVLWLAGALLTSRAVVASEFRVDEVTTRLEGETVVLDARIDYRFSAVALEALDNGVPLTLEVHVQLRPADAWVWEDSLVDQRLRYMIRYKPLSERYLVSRLPDTGGRDYVTRDAAIAALGDIRGLDLVSIDRLEPNREYEVHLQASLDVESLPLPLKPMAYLLPSWKLSSGWTKWPLQR